MTHTNSQLMRNDGHPVSEQESVVTADALTGWITSVLTAHAIPESAAATIADCLVNADMKGVTSHGVSRLPVYLQRLSSGVVNPDPNPEIVADSHSALLIDADGGFGHPVAAFGMTEALTRANLTGAAVVGIRNSSHFGMAGYYAEMAAKREAIGIVSTNSSPRMAPWGGKNALLGTNPLAIAAPGPAGPIVLDMATSVAALGRITVAAAAGASIPEGWAFDPGGRPTTDPAAALAGTLAPIGGPEGSGLAFMLDILCGVLTGGAFGRRVRSLYRDSNLPEQCGHFIFAIDIKAFIAPSAFHSAMREYVTEFKGSGPAEDVNEIFLPGEIQQRLEHRARIRGIALRTPILDELRRLADDSGVALPEMTAAAGAEAAGRSR